MKKSAVKLIVSMSFILIGIVLIFSGFAVSGFSFEEVFRDDRVKRTVELSGDFSRITIDCNLDSIEFLPAEGDSCVVEVYENDNYQYDISESGGELSINCEEDYKWYQDTRWSMLFSQKTIMVYLPQQSYRSLNVTTDIGSLKLYGGFQIEEAMLKTNIGEIEVTGANHDRKATDHVYRSLRLKTDIGSIKVDGGLAVKEGEYKTNIGEISIEVPANGLPNDYVCEKLQLSTNIGSIHVAPGYLVASIQAESNIGEVDAPVPFSSRRTNFPNGMEGIIFN